MAKRRKGKPNHKNQNSPPSQQRLARRELRRLQSLEAIEKKNKADREKAEQLAARQREVSEAAGMLRQDKRVRTVAVQKTNFAFETNWIYALVEGHRLVVGRWFVELSEEFGYVKVTCRETSVEGNAYLYCAGGFCFGTRAEYIRELVRCGEYLAAAYVILDSFAHINPADWAQARNMYQHEACAACRGELPWKQRIMSRLRSSARAVSDRLSRSFLRNGSRTG